MSTHTIDELTGFAVDLGGTKIAAAAIENGKVADVLVRRTDGNAGPLKLVAELADIARQIGFKDGDPIGVAVAGRLDSEGLWSAVNTSILADLNEQPLASELGKYLGSGVVALNDTRAAVIGEYRFGAAQNTGAAAYLTVSTGVSAGIVLNGVPLQSPNGLLGHVGFMTSRHGTRSCGSGRTGTFESIASGRAIEAKATELGFGGTTCEQVFDHAASGEKWAQQLIQDSSAAIAELCANLAASLGIERVVIGGGVGLAPGYLDRVKTHLLDEPELFRPEIVGSSLGKHSALFGALSVAVERKAKQ
ncbi:ROK family protein [Aliiroseovarius sp. PrR006]|uniref:ROK family protein n=1 Tax=Aliiroseovarius sp. PrR006 TaxID=2706883 RepID=UPI0013D44A82|nr:ROK family protein [Aliiroseovarius sp. PrR006]NDW54269.1 ROK family protein [Aliiroseovarius sp. PrR006]